MATLTELSTWESGIYRLETADPVQGGVGGVSNTQPNQLANRTRKIYDTMALYGLFINPAEQAFVGQMSYVDANFEGTVVDGDVVYWDTLNSRFAKAVADGSAAQYAIAIADVTNGIAMTGGLIHTAYSFTSGQILYLDDTLPGVITTTATAIALGRYEFDGVISFFPSAAATATAASIPPGTITEAQLSFNIYTEAEIDAKCGNWDSAYSERLQWDGGATGLNASTARTSLGLTGDVSSHHHDSMYYTETEINAKCANWDSAYTQRMQWDGGSTNLNVSNARTNLGLTGDVTSHCHDARYYTETEINAKCSNWDSAYTQRFQWDGGSTNLVPSTGRTSLGLGSMATQNADNVNITGGSIGGISITTNDVVASERLVIPTDEPTTLIDGCIWLV